MLIFFVVVGGFAVRVSAQSFKATVIGTVLDSSGAVVPGATVSIVQEAPASQRARRPAPRAPSLCRNSRQDDTS